MGRSSVKPLHSGQTSAADASAGKSQRCVTMSPPIGVQWRQQPPSTVRAAASVQIACRITVIKAFVNENSWIGLLSLV